MQLSRFGWDVSCGQSYYSEKGGYQEIGKKKNTSSKKAWEAGRASRSTSLPASLSGPEDGKEGPRMISYSSRVLNTRGQNGLRELWEPGV